MLNIERIYGLMPHCETVFPNHQCPYIEKGCSGCRMHAELREKYLETMAERTVRYGRYSEKLVQWIEEYEKGDDNL